MDQAGEAVDPVSEEEEDIEEGAADSTLRGSVAVGAARRRVTRLLIAQHQPL